MCHLEQHNVLFDKQHRFRKGLSCETQLASLANDLATTLDSKGQANMIIMDFSKAFDTVPHERLLLKLFDVGIRNNTLTWIRNFLTRRHHRVVLDGKSSAEAKVLSGVPQGTVLGPLLYLVYINDLPRGIQSDIRLFADDCILYREIKSPEDQLKVQQDLNGVIAWEKKWEMSFNRSKCYSMSVTHKRKPLKFTYKMNDTPLIEVEHHPYLGVEISKDLNWSRHIQKICNKANSMLGLLRRNIHCCPVEVKSIAYKSLVRPRLEYCNTVLGPLS